jgi:tetratricopeptide (TPR) repeat protein
MTKLLDKIISWGLIVLVGLIPLFFLPFTSEFYEFNKNILLYCYLAILLIAWVLRMVLEKKVSFRRTPLDLPILAVAGAFILSTLFASPNKWETLWIPGGTGTIIGLTILFFIITNNISGSVKSVLISVISASLILSLITIYQFIGLGETLIPTNSFWAFLRPKFWTPAGGLLPLATFLAVSLALTGSTLIKQIKNRLNRSVLSVSLSVISVSLMGVALGIALYQLLTTAKPLLLPYSTSWAIAVETLKNWRLFLFGVGPTSFLEAFSQFRPLAYNLTNLWAVRFGVSGSWYLHLLTTVGVIGLAGWLWFIWKVTRSKFQISSFQFPINLRISIFLIFLILLFLPANFLLLFVLYLLVAILAATLPAREYTEDSKVVPWAVFIPTLLVVIVGLWLSGRAYAAEVYFRRSFEALAKNDGTGTYNNQIKAITLNPHNDNYRMAYSQTNLALANSLATNPPGGTLSDQDRQNITILVQQAIREAKNAVALNRNRIINWENLAGIYRQLINFAQGADQWAVAATRQAIVLDPVNPNLRLNLGGIYYGLQQYDESIRWFQRAVDIKPDFANGYYNLAAAWREKGDFVKAHEMMQMVVSLVPTTSEDYPKAQQELEELAKKVPAVEATPAAEATPSAAPAEAPAPLTEPQPLPSPVIKPPLELPEGAAPPAPELSPAPPATP